jgi:hypothetical protein
MKILFIPLSDGFEVRSLCSHEEVSGAVETIKIKLGDDTEIYALDCPDFTITGADLAGDRFEAAMNKAVALVKAALERGRTENDLTGLECLNPPADIEEEEEEEEEPPTRDPDIAPVNYVLFRASKNDYLCEIRETDEVTHLNWYTHPEKAIHYKTFKEAEKMARYVVEDATYVLTVCELHETEKQFWTRRLKDYRSNSSAGISLN